VKAALWVSQWGFLFVAWLIFAASLKAQEWAFGTHAAAAGVLGAFHPVATMRERHVLLAGPERFT
jgi:multisubunit Na+/H+ antiporter MnhE subunit